MNPLYKVSQFTTGISSFCVYETNAITRAQRKAKTLIHAKIEGPNSFHQEYLLGKMVFWKFTGASLPK